MAFRDERHGTPPSIGATVVGVEAAIWSAIAIVAALSTSTLFVLGSRIDGLSSRIDGLSSRIDGLSSRMDGRFDRVEDRLARVERDLHEHISPHAG